MALESRAHHRVSAGFEVLGFRAYQDPKKPTVYGLLPIVSFYKS